MHDSFGEDEKEQLKKVDKKRKKEMRDNLEEEQKEYQKKRIAKEKKQSMITLTLIKKIS